MKDACFGAYSLTLGILGTHYLLEFSKNSWPEKQGFGMIFATGVLNLSPRRRGSSIDGKHTVLPDVIPAKAGIQR